MRGTTDQHDASADWMRSTMSTRPATPWGIWLVRRDPQRARPCAGWPSWGRARPAPAAAAVGGLHSGGDRSCVDVHDGRFADAAASLRGGLLLSTKVRDPAYSSHRSTSIARRARTLRATGGSARAARRGPPDRGRQPGALVRAGDLAGRRPARAGRGRSSPWPKRGSRMPSPAPAGSVSAPGSCAPPPRLPASGPSRASGEGRTASCTRSMLGSPRASISPT